MKTRATAMKGRRRRSAADKTGGPAKQKPKAAPKTEATTATSEKVPLLLEHFPGPGMERVQLLLYRPEATEVFVAGTFNDWEPTATPLQSDGDGGWTVELELVQGRHEYRFLVDGDWADDPLASAYVPNAFGGLNCLLVV